MFKQLFYCREVWWRDKLLNVFVQLTVNFELYKTQNSLQISEIQNISGNL